MAATDCTGMSKGSKLEKNYRPVLLREEVKAQVKDFQRKQTDREIYQERRLITAAVTIVLEKPELHELLLKKAAELMAVEAQELLEAKELVA